VTGFSTEGNDGKLRTDHGSETANNISTQKTKHAFNVLPDIILNKTINKYQTHGPVSAAGTTSR